LRGFRILVPLLLQVLPWLLISWWLHATHRLVSKPGLVGLTSSHHFWALSGTRNFSYGEQARNDNELLIL
jgi:hypothetical protein